MNEQTCVIVGASHGGVSSAFALRKEGWQGKIILIDGDPNLPYHRPPLSKSFLTDDQVIKDYKLKSSEAYTKESIELRLGERVEKINTSTKSIISSDKNLTYDKLILATGAEALIPPIKGINDHKGIFVLRNASDVHSIKEGLNNVKKAAVIGGGYIGLEIASSLRKLGLDVLILEKENRLLSRVTSPEMSRFFLDLHQSHGVRIELSKEVKEITEDDNGLRIVCYDGSAFESDLIVLGVGIKVNKQLAAHAGIKTGNGIEVDQFCRTSDRDIYAIGDCTWHYNLHYKRYIRLESVQNATDQGKTVAKHINGKEEPYDTIPWFWSDQYDVKLQMVGLSDGYDELVCRSESDPSKQSYWYFNSGKLIAVDAINNPKAYVLGTKFIKNRHLLDKEKLKDPSIDLKDLQS